MLAYISQSKEPVGNFHVVEHGESRVNGNDRQLHICHQRLLETYIGK